MKSDPIRFTTAQFAKLHGLNKRTLHYYDDIGLFSPIDKGDNHYRYYDFLQSFELEMILMLKEQHMSIEEIKGYMQQPDPKRFLQIADQKLEDIDQEILKLKQTKKILKQKVEQIQLCQQIQALDIHIETRNEEYLLITPLQDLLEDKEEIIRHLKQVWDVDQYRVGCGSYISVEKVMQKQWQHYDGIYTPIKQRKQDTNILKKPKGEYLIAYYKGDWDGLPVAYEKILAYADAHQLTLCGNAYELGLNEFAISNMTDYVTQIIIQVDSASM